MNSDDSEDVWAIENGVHLRKCLLNSQEWHILLQNYACYLFSDISPIITLDWRPLRASDLFLSFSLFCFKASGVCEMCVSAPQHSIFVTHDKECVLQAPVYGRNVCSGIWGRKTFGGRAGKLYREEESKSGTTFSHCRWRVLHGIFLLLHYSLVRSQSELNTSLQNSLEAK